MFKLPWFQMSVVASFLLFCGMTFYVVWVVWQRPTTGLMGIDAAKIQVLRVTANEELKATSQGPE